jgi:uncharacterized protein (TIGR02466 family)
MNYSCVSTDIVPLFPSLIHIIDVNNFPKNFVVDYVYKQREKDPVGLKLTNRGGWQSQPSYDESDNILKSLIVDGTLKHLGNIISSGKEISFEGIWININGKNAYNKLHNHPTSDLAGVFWIKVPNNSGRLELHSPIHFGGYAAIDSYTKDFNNRYHNHHTYVFKPKEGQMLIFPSYLYHCVEENESEEDRISVSFNIRLNN